jgi:hypothetical protein
MAPWRPSLNPPPRRGLLEVRWQLKTPTGDIVEASIHRHSGDDYELRMSHGEQVTYSERTTSLGAARYAADALKADLLREHPSYTETEEPGTPN